MKNKTILTSKKKSVLFDSKFGFDDLIDMDCQTFFTTPNPVFKQQKSC